MRTVGSLVYQLRLMPERPVPQDMGDIGHGAI
jgi:hypothetical protein